MVKGEENNIAYNKVLFDMLANDIAIYGHSFVDYSNRRIDPRIVTVQYERVFHPYTNVPLREDKKYSISSEVSTTLVIHEAFIHIDELKRYFEGNMMCTSYAGFLEQQKKLAAHYQLGELIRHDAGEPGILDTGATVTINGTIIGRINGPINITESRRSTSLNNPNIQTQTDSMEAKQTHTADPNNTKKKKVKKEKKFEKLTPDPRTTFGKFGLELTFMPNVKLPDIWVTDSNESIWHEVTRQMSRSVKDDANISHDWWENIEMDDNGLELPTPTVETFDEFMVEYKKLSKELKHWGLVPSSNICMESEGGCHQNFDLEWMTNLHGNTFSCNFLFNLINYIRTYPSITWCFLSPYDNISSTLGYHNEGSYVQNQGRLNNWGKGDFLTVHGSPAYHDGEPNYKLGMNRVDYVELRFFMMPRNNREMKCHWEFTNKLLLYIYHKTCEGVKFEKPEGQNKDSFKEITYQKAKSMVNKVCTDIGYDFVELKRVGKFDLLQQRFDLGEEYLR